MEKTRGGQGHTFGAVATAVVRFAEINKTLNGHLWPSGVDVDDVGAKTETSLFLVLLVKQIDAPRETQLQLQGPVGTYLNQRWCTEY